MIELINDQKPFDYDALCNTTKELKEEYPFLQQYPIGKTSLKRNINTYILGQGSTNVLFAGCFCASDYTVSKLLLLFLSNICSYYKNKEPFYKINLNRLFQGIRLFVLPMINKDGVEIRLHGPQSADIFQHTVANISQGNYPLWEGNARGVDINQNFNINFEFC